MVWRLAGIPNWGTDDARPVAVGSVICRAWHRTLLRWALPLPDRHVGGQPGSSVPLSCASWFHAPVDAGSESDMRKAFDSVDHLVARAAVQ